MRRRLGTTGVVLAMCGLLGACVVAPPPPAPRGEWIAGYYGPGGAWYPGHWVHPHNGPPPEAAEAPPGYGSGRIWIRGHYGESGEWRPGHWAPG